MPVNISEANLETIIERVLLTGQAEVEAHLAESKPTYQTIYASGGYHKRTPADYHRAYCLDVGMLVKFLQATQPQTWQRFSQFHDDPAHTLATDVSRIIAKKGTLELFRKGYSNSGCKFKLVYFRPNTSLNQEHQRQYQANLFSVIRQLQYRPEGEKSQPELDLTLFLNGLPLFTAELKNRFTRQTVFDAIKQYKETRPAHEPLFRKGRCLAHFAIDTQLVYFTPFLADGDTRFFPFNQGYNFGAGNPPVHPSSNRFANSYLWESIWSRDSILNLVQKFVQFYDAKDEKGRKTGEKRLVFPRYHQLTAVRQLTTHAREHGAGQRYLIQHSAGSGKTYTIAWLAHQLATLHNDLDELVFDSVLVISDRRILDDQLQQTMRDFEQKRGVVENIEKTSRQLKQALEDGKRIIVTTLQKFPVIARQIDTLSGSRFAVIVDEAHSSQSGSSTQALNRALHIDDNETEETSEDMEDVLVQEMQLRRHLPNVSTFAFTATPKPKTLQLFGRKMANGSYQPFSLYPMRQAIEEGFIMDVLQNYTTYKAYFRLLKTVEDDPHYDKRKATRLLKAFIDDHAETIEMKTAVIVEHFASQVAHRINGKAKAMIVTRSRAHAVRYKLAVDAYIQAQGYPFQSLVAFSGKVTDDTQTVFTETSMNTTAVGKRIRETETAETFKQPEFGLLIVANKFQTGFDQPLLHTMYVDKKLGGVNAVQTLSRLNRYHPEKEETMVLDFVNEAEAIQKAFEPYYEQTILSEGTNPNVLYQLQNELSDFHFYDNEEIEAFVTLYYQGRNHHLARLYNIVEPAVKRFVAASDEEKAEFRKRLNDFVRLYAFLAQVLPFVETDWERLFHYGRLLLTALPIDREQLPQEVQQEVDMAAFRLQQTFEGSLSLERGNNTLRPVGQGGSYTASPETLEPLSVILEELNRLGGIKPTDDNKAAVRQLQTKLQDDPALEASVRVNAPETARLTFDEVAQDLFEEMIEDNFKFYKHVTDDPTLKKRFFDWLFDEYLRTHKQIDE